MRPVVSGNLAYDYDKYYEEEQVKTSKKPAEAKQSQAKKQISLGVIMFYAIVICAMAFCLIGREVEIYARNSEVAERESELVRMRAQAKQYKMEAEAELDLAAIEQTAVEEYNMKRPETHQIVYVNLHQEDVIEGSGEAKRPTVVQKVLGIINNW